MYRFKLISLIVTVVLILSACSQTVSGNPPTVAPVAMPTDTKAPLSMAPTSVPAASETPAPTAMNTISPTSNPTQVPNTIVDVAIASGKFKTLVAAIQAAGLVDALKGNGPFTVFAPTDDAFAKLPKGTLENLLKPENKAMLASILLYHVVPGQLMAADVVNLKQATTLDGPAINIKVSGSTVMVNNANVVATDISASNGVIHVIDTVLLPPEMMAPNKNIVDTAVANGSFKTLVSAIQAAGLVDTLKGKGPFTVFAPTDAAFNALPAGTLTSLLKPENKQKLTDILTYHVVSGNLSPVDLYTNQQAQTVESENIKFTVKNGSFYVNDAQVVLAAIPTTNGIIYVINQVLLPQKITANAPAMDIVDTAGADGRFKTLVAAIQAAGLTDTLKGPGPFTVFAPTDEAFAKLSAGTLASLMMPANQQKLTDILTYHVIAGKLMAADVVKLSSAKTVEGKSVTITVSNGKVYVNNA